jgi:hypothetical protein
VEDFMMLFKALSRYFPGSNDTIDERLQSKPLVFVPRIEPGTSRIRSKNANYSRGIFGVILLEKLSKTARNLSHNNR